MKNIQAEKYRKGSEILLSDKLSARIVNDDLKSSCTIYFQVLDKLNQQLDQGNLSISGDDYQAWDGSSEQLYQYIAKQLNLEITGDYVEEKEFDISVSSNGGLIVDEPITDTE